MDSIMRAYKKNKALICGLVLLISLERNSYAENTFVKIEKLTLELAEQKATLIAELDFQLSTTAREALHSGIVLYWDVSIVLQQKKWAGLWSKTLLSQSNRYSLAYYTLLNNYRLKDEYAQVFRRFSSLSEAQMYMRYIKYADMPVLAYRTEQCVAGVLKVSFDKEMLPTPLRPIAYFDKQWDLSANERLWCE